MGLGTGIIFITGALGVGSILALAWRRPWHGRTGDLINAVYLISVARSRWPAGRHALLTDEPARPLAGWAGPIVGVDVCARCACPMQGGACPRCHWERPPDRAPWPRLTDADRAALAAGLETSRAIAAEPRPGAVLMPAPTDHISGAGRDAEPAAGAWRAAYAELAPAVAPEPAQPPSGAAEPEPPPGWGDDTLRLNPPPSLAAAWEPPPPEPELPPHGDWLPGTGPPSDDDEPGPWAPHGYAYGAMRWAPSRKATAADAEHAADLARQDADAAEFIDAMAAERRRYVWQLRRGFLAQRGLAF